MKAVLLIRVAPTREKIVAKQLVEDFPEVFDAWAVFGEYDIVAMLEAESIEVMSRLITNHIRKMKGVLKTSTLVFIT
ncbi:MAG: Lrp/AsnC ligand binding domain-containing protein [Candidatus Odinarchaeota archaeon]